MTLDEAIKHAEEVAEIKLQDAELSEIQGCYNNAKKCYACAEEHRQLAKWLKELKQLKERESCEMTAEEYRQRMIQAFHNVGTDELIAICVLPTKKEFEHLEWLLKNHYKKEPCEDCINREAMLETQAKYAEYMGATKFWQMRDDIRALPPVTSQPERKPGHWEWVQYDYNPKFGNWHCSECRSIVIECADKNEKGGISLYEYCPKCGAKMEE